MNKTMKLYRIKLSTKTPRYNLKTVQLTANSLDEAINRLEESKFSKVESVAVFIEREDGGVWNSYLEQRIKHLNH
jgi:K+ transporter